MAVERDTGPGTGSENVDASDTDEKEGSGKAPEGQTSSDASKGDVLAFVRGAQGNPRRRKSFVDGEWWSDDAEFRTVYVEEKWTDSEGFVNKQGAAIINYADSLYDEENGFDAVLAELNRTGVDTFVRKAVGLHDSGEFAEEDGGDGFTDTGSFTGDGGFF